MFSHNQVWSAIDALAERQKMSVSRLARTAGLDPTTFNKSKRVANDGRQRWPSTESLAKVMQVTNTGLEAFTALMLGQDDTFPPVVSTLQEQGFRELDSTPFVPPPSVPLLGLAQAGAGGFFDDSGLPSGEGWDAVEFPQANGESVYALEVSGDSMMPLYRDGDRIIVSPISSVRRGDRVVVRTLEGEVMAKVLARQTANSIELASLNPEHPTRVFNLDEIDWVARIIWASQ